MKSVLVPIFFIFFLGFNKVFAQKAMYPHCTRTSTKELPFYISDTYDQGKKIWENFRKNDISTVLEGEMPGLDKYIPKGSLVHVQPAFEIQYGDTLDYVPVKVLSVPRANTALTLRQIANNKDRKNYLRSGIREIFGSKKDTKYPPAQINDYGYLHKRSLKKIEEQDMVFIIDSDTPLLPQMPTFQDVPYTKVRFAQSDEGYLTNRCCSESSNKDSNNNVCITEYILELLDENSSGKDLFISINPLDQCRNLSTLLPFKEEVFNKLNSYIKKIAKIPGVTLRENLDYLEASEAGVDLVKIPIGSGGQGPYGSFHYLPDDTVNSDVYATPDAACAFVEIAKAWSKLCPEDVAGCQLMFGDIFHKRGWNRHRAHHSGTCFDIRPFRKENSVGGLSYKDWLYDKNKTKLFMQLLKEAGSNSILFNDERLILGPRGRKTHQLPRIIPDKQKVCVYNEKKGKKRCPPHDNHIHFCLPSHSDGVKDACVEGINTDSLSPIQKK